MKKYINKKSIIIASVMLLLLVAVGTTLAYIFTETNPVENTFNPSKVACAVVENNNPDENRADIVLNDSIKTNVQIKNTGDTDAYIRVAVVVNWMSEDGTKVWATKPVKSTDGTQYHLSIEIVASAIQAKPTSVVTSQWGVTVANDGTISK